MTTTEKKSTNSLNTANTDEINLIDVFLKLWRFRKFIIFFTFGVAVVAVIYSLMQDPQYEASVKLYKETSEGQSSRVQSLASQFGMGGALQGGGGQFSIEDLLNSRNLNKRILYKKWKTEAYKDSVNLINYWEIEGETEEQKIYQALGTIKNKVSLDKDEKTGLITIKVMMAEPQLAADVANYITEIISDYVQTERQTSTRENLKYIEKRLETVKQELKEAEESLKRFRERNRVISKSPELQMKQSRLQRKVNIKQQVYLKLEQEREMTEVELVKETPVINVLDEAVKPEQRAKPKRKLIVIVGTFAGFFLSILLVVLRYVWIYVKREINERGESLKLF